MFQQTFKLIYAYTTYAYPAIQPKQQHTLQPSFTKRNQQHYNNKQARVHRTNKNQFIQTMSHKSGYEARDAPDVTKLKLCINTIMFCNFLLLTKWILKCFEVCLLLGFVL